MKINLPLYVQTGKSDTCKKYYINMNQYRVRNWIVSNNVKKKFTDLLKDELKDKVVSTPFKIKYTLYMNDLRVRDVNNVLAVADKFFQDALVKYGCIDDDNYKHSVETLFTFGGLDRGNGRVEVEIDEEVKTKL